ncbi:hypothetical protein N7475_008601 [Penicillium sp. IBT 31633x]|nr:hypothetical protein N7475_008601 [Penicillium sp. IBT 31633x]
MPLNILPAPSGSNFDKDSTITFKGRIQVAGRRVSTLQKLEEDIRVIREPLSITMDAMQLKNHNETQDDISDM